MYSKIKIALIILSGLIGIALISLLLGGIQTLANLSGYADPAYVPYVFWGLTTLAAFLFGYVILSFFIFPKPLFLRENASKKELAEYHQAYLERLQRNPFLRKKGISCKTEEDMVIAVAALEEQTNKLIEETAKRVFVGTATAQNGRLDTLIVFGLVTHLIYKITQLHSQRPHINDLLLLYKNVALTAFFAGALEDVVIEEYTQQIVGPLVATSVVGSIPGAQAIAAVVTSSILDGSTNSLLCMRCGIIARNYMRMPSSTMQTKQARRKSASKEAAAMFMKTSGETISNVTQMLVSGASASVKSSMKKAWEAVCGTNTTAVEPEEAELENAPLSNEERTSRLSKAKERITSGADSVTGYVRNTSGKAVEGAKSTGSYLHKKTTKVVGKADHGVRKSKARLAATSKNAKNIFLRPLRRKPTKDA